ncbi:MAG TPA: hypothetical protein VL981_14680 [Candidatus Methylacidiphilales bacterium]|nr:hypothetical protein [Candidatus Methylacidiphilales bacterium]
MSDLTSIDNQLLEIFQNDKAREALKANLARHGLNIYSLGRLLRQKTGTDLLLANIENSIVEARMFLK